MWREGWEVQSSLPRPLGILGLKSQVMLQDVGGEEVPPSSLSLTRIREAWGGSVLGYRDFELVVAAGAGTPFALVGMGGSGEWVR